MDRAGVGVQNVRVLIRVLEKLHVPQVENGSETGEDVCLVARLKTNQVKGVANFVKMTVAV